MLRLLQRVLCHGSLAAHAASSAPLRGWVSMERARNLEESLYVLSVGAPCGVFRDRRSRYLPVSLFGSEGFGPCA